MNSYIHLLEANDNMGKDAASAENGHERLGIREEEESSFLGLPITAPLRQTHSPIFNVKSYTVLLSVIYACCSAGTAVIIGTVTTLQKAFGFSSTQVCLFRCDKHRYESLSVRTC